MFVDLQNAWYNTLTKGLGLSRQTFQIIQPSPPLVANDDRQLWDRYFNIIPPRSLTQNFIQSAGNQYFSNYKAMIGALKGSINERLSDVIGQDNANAWTASRVGQPPIPLNAIPQSFFAWAFMNAPDVASAGATYLSSILLDPITSAGVAGALGPYTPSPVINPNQPSAPPLQPEWSAGYRILTEQLANSPQISFEFDSSTESSDVSDTWTAGANVSFFGLFGAGASFSHERAEQFSSSKVTVRASFGHVLNFLAIPGSWFTSSAMGIAFSNPGNPPWADGLVRWDNTFGPEGNMTRFTVSLIVVDTMNVTVTSEAKFSEEERRQFFEAEVRGVWPFYASGGAGNTTTTSEFSDDGRATVTIASAPGIPMVIGANVLPIEDYIGHEVRARALFDIAIREHELSDF